MFDGRSTLTARLTNSSASTKRLVLEPWGEVYEFPPGAIAEMVAEASTAGFPEFDYADEQITIYGWPGSIVTLFMNGVELGRSPAGKPPAPPTSARPR